MALYPAVPTRPPRASPPKVEQRPTPRPRRWHLILLPLLLALLLYLLPPPKAPLPHPATTTTTALLSALRTRTAQVRLLSEEVVYSAHARVYARTVRFPSGNNFTFDVWGRVWRNDSFSVVSVVPFDRATQTFTMLREYNVAHGRFVYAFPQGQFERVKHASLRDAARAELEEEAGLRCTSWTDLLAEGVREGAPQDKYQREKVFYFLCTAVEAVAEKAEVDAEEEIEVVSGVTPGQVRELVAEGVLQSNNIAAALMALDRLRRMRLLPCDA